MTTSQIRNLEFRFFSNFGKNYLTVDYTRDGEYNHTTYVVSDEMRQTEKSVRKFLKKI